MHTSTATGMLFLDDSGHPALNHHSRAVVVGGFAIASASVPDLNRRIARAKSRLFPERGRPARWEVKASGTIKSNRWSPPNPPIADPVPAHFRRAGYLLGTMTSSSTCPRFNYPDREEHGADQASGDQRPVRSPVS